MKGVLKSLMFGLILLSAGTVYAQSMQEVQQTVKANLDRLHYWRYEYSPEDSGVDPNASTADSVLYMNKLLVNYLQETGKSIAVLKGPYKTMEEDEIKVTTSDDGKVRIYSWDTETGDDMHIYNAVVQYEAGGVSKTKVLKDISTSADNKKEPGFLYPEIYTLNGSTKYYLVVYSGILSSENAKKGIRAFTIKNNELQDADIFQSANGLTNKIEYTYDYFSNYDYQKMQEKQVINLKKDELSVPTLDGNKLNGKWIVYRFEGDKFAAK